MIGKGKTISHTLNSLNYARSKENAREVDRNLLSGDTANDLANEFMIFQKMNTRTERNTFSFVLSPVDDDSANMTKREWKEITRTFLEKMALDDRQYIAYKHDDNGHNHLHIYVNRINERGEAASDQFISNKASRVAEEIAREKNMKLAADIRKEYQRKQSGKYRRVYEAHKKVMQDCIYISEYISRMEKMGYKPHFKYSTAGHVVGVQYQVNGSLVKGSAIHRSMSGRKIGQALKEDRYNKQKEENGKKFTKQWDGTYKHSQMAPGYNKVIPSISTINLKNGESADGDEEEEREKDKNRGLER